MTPDKKPTLAEALRGAYEEPRSCPPPEAFLAPEMAAMSRAERARLASHADACPACAAERDLARAFGPAAAASAGESREVDRIVRRLRRRAPGRKRRWGALPGLPSLSDLARSPAARLAAAAVLVVVIGVAVQTSRSGPPRLPDSAEDGVMRGSLVTAVSPVGEVGSLPEELRWEALEGAAEYRVTLRTVDDTVLWQSVGGETSARLPAAVRAGLHRAVTYAWSVDALDAAGKKLGGSGRIDFWARPEDEG